MKLIVFSLLLSASSPAIAQSTDGISAPVSRTVTLTPDEATFTLVVSATLESTQQQVKQALQTAGLPNPTVVATGLGLGGTDYSTASVQMLYSASVVIPAGSAIDTAKSLETLRANLPAPLKGLQYGVGFNPSQAKVDAMRQVLLPQLLDESRKVAQSLAAASGVKVGAIRAISDSLGGVYAYLGSAPGGVVRNGDFSQIYDPLTSFLLYSPPSSTQYTFSLNVVFATQSEPRP